MSSFTETVQFQTSVDRSEAQRELNSPERAVTDGKQLHAASEHGLCRKATACVVKWRKAPLRPAASLSF